MPTTSTKLGECKSFCAQSQDSWSFKCSWDCCTGCKECAATTTTTTTGIAASTTAPPLSQVCKSWCAGNAKPWVKKCTWEKCREEYQTQAYKVPLVTAPLEVSCMLAYPAPKQVCVTKAIEITEVKCEDKVENKCFNVAK